MNNAIVLFAIGSLLSCRSKVSTEELEYVNSNAWVRSDPGGFSSARFHFDTFTGPSFGLSNDTVYLFDGEFIGIISSVDTINEVLVLRSFSGMETSNYKRTFRRATP